jgi:hypothetical protein
VPRFATFALVAALLALAALLVPLAFAEVSQKQGVRVSVNGSIKPSKLPRAGAAPVAVSFSGKIGAAESGNPPQLTKLSIAINRSGHLDTRGLPLCRMNEIDPSTSEDAIAVCRSSLIGEGSFSANVKFPQQSPFPSQGKVLAFNGRLRGRPAVFAHIFGTRPVPTSIVLPFLIEETGGTFGTQLTASLPRVTGDWGYVTGLAMTLRRQFNYKGKSRSYLSAGCPAPAGFHQVFFPLARTSFSFAGGLTVSSTLTRGCRVRG